MKARSHTGLGEVLILLVEPSVGVPPLLSNHGFAQGDVRPPFLRADPS